MAKVKCDECKKEWNIHILCPDCWERFIRHIKRDSTCYKCGNDYYSYSRETEEGDEVMAVFCVNCRDMYVPMGGGQWL